MSYTAELKDVSKTFDGITALDNLNLKVKNREILAVLGPNGSGKTTLLKILAFLEKPSKGEVYFLNHKVTEKNMPQMRMESTMVFQKTVLFNTTVYNNIAYGLKTRKLAKGAIDDKVKESLRLVRLEGLETRRAKGLSGGEQRRVALARSLVLDTRLLLLDEPTADLDPKNASIIEEVIESISHELETTIVMATHNMFQAKTLPHHIALITNGKVDEVGTPAEVFGKLSKALVSFAALENTFAGTAKLTKAGTALVDIGNGVKIEATAQREGKVSIFISPEDIILSKRRFASSARNVFKGKIEEILDFSFLVRLKVEVGKPFMVQITRRSFNEMELNLDSEVFLSFKASSVEFI